ncbi:MAG: beta-ketoacyl-ACP synthase II [Desulfobacterales bacterium]|nr:MAG: beta-ketoacyl-ACP synthase II [Desulfobacterales bacterium]
MKKTIGLKRVVVTGLGMITSLGLSAKDTWKAMLEGKSGIDYITQWGELSEVKNKFQLSDDFPLIAGEVKDFNIKQLIKQRKTEVTKEDLKQVKYMDAFTQFAYAATLEAIADANVNLEDGEVNPDRVGVIIGSGLGGPKTWENEFERFMQGKRVSPFLIPRMIPNLAAGNVSISFKAKGANACIATACASGAHAIGEALQRIQLGKEDALACGGTEASITPLTVAGFHALKALSPTFKTPQSASRPFDIGRNGFVMGDGAGIIILEELEHALARGARIYAEVIGFAMTGDASHITDPDVGGAIRCMTLALEDAGIDAEEVDLINPHATSTPKGDINESRAIMEVFGANRDKPLITANKSQLGHSLGAIGGIEAASTVLSVYEDNVPPILNLDQLDPECQGLNYVSHQAKQETIHTALSNSFGFGGTNASLVFRKYA